MMEQLPKWLYNIAYGLGCCRRLRILINGTRFAVVQSPGVRWYDNSGGHYGATAFYLVDKDNTMTMRSGIGLLDCHTLQDGGRAKLAKWKKLVEQADKTPELLHAMLRKPKPVEEMAVA